MGPNRITNTQALERSFEADLFITPGDGMAPRYIQYQPTEKLLGELDKIFIRGVGHIEFDHRELRVMPMAQPLVSEVSVELVDALDSTDHQTFQIQLRRDP